MPEKGEFDLDAKGVALEEGTLSAQDCVLIVTDHSEFDDGWIGRHASLIVDTRGAMRRVADRGNVRTV
jgi:UDP-N-acetyl-D-glucosamine dehydrogenase